MLAKVVFSKIIDIDSALNGMIGDALIMTRHMSESGLAAALREAIRIQHVRAADVLNGADVEVYRLNGGDPL